MSRGPNLQKSIQKGDWKASSATAKKGDFLGLSHDATGRRSRHEQTERLQLEKKSPPVDVQCQAEYVCVLVGASFAASGFCCSSRCVKFERAKMGLKRCFFLERNSFAAPSVLAIGRDAMATHGPTIKAGDSDDKTKRNCLRVRVVARRP